MNQYVLSLETKASINEAYHNGLAPSVVAKALGLAMTTVIRQYLLLDQGVL